VSEIDAGTGSARPTDDDTPDGAHAPGAPHGPDEAPRSARVLVAVLLVLLLVPGVIGFDLWPLTGWRLFSLSRDEDQTRWVVEAVDADGTRRVVSLEELPLRYRHAEWPMAELPGSSQAKRDGVCQALLGAVVDVEPSSVEVAVSRDHARLVERDGEWSTEHDVEVFHTCRPEGADGAAGEGGDDR
jgi:hypothetical protein